MPPLFPKIYNLLSYEIADRIFDTVEGVEEVYVWLISQIGRPINEPWLASASVRLKPDTAFGDIKDKARNVIEAELANISAFCGRLIGGAASVC